ncbi:MAG TPA: DUF1080 domain-containing protein [Bryobacteraceae bacterium]|nr:DUF1080 domain-containing protein [Bryobacteraceae bacterium]
MSFLNEPTRRAMLALAPAALLAQNKLDPAKIVPPFPETGFKTIFDGKTLDGWDADPDFWHVANGAIAGETTPTQQPKQNTFCIWRGAQPADFDFRAQYRLTGGNAGNSGFQYRSVERPDVAKWVMQGYQADIDAQQTFTGQLYEERGRGFLALRGMLGYAADGTKPGMLGAVGDSDQLKSYIKVEDWNDIQIIARGNSLVHLWNGHVMCVFLDDDAAHRKAAGLIGIQLHVTQTGMKIETRNIRIKIL